MVNQHNQQQQQQSNLLDLQPPSSGSAVPSLKDLLLGGDRVLVLDGGVSTHLEGLILAAADKGAIARGDSDKSNDGDDNSTPKEAFRYRELWSSSLLVPSSGDGDDDGRRDRDLDLILQGHLDWLRAGADVVTTVTYQCHYRPDLWPEKQQTNENESSSSSGEAGTTRTPLLTNDAVDRMYDTAQDLAQRAVEEYQAEADAEPASSITAGAIATGRPRRRPVFAAVSLGCFGAALANGAEYTGDYDYGGGDSATTTLDDLVDFHWRRLEYLFRRRRRREQQRNATGGQHPTPPAVVIETVPSLLECQAVAKLLLDENNTNKNDDNENDDGDDNSPAVVELAWLSLACRNGTELNDGTPLASALAALRPVLAAQRVWGIGFNCCKASYLSSLVEILVDFLLDDDNNNSPPLNVAIALYPNSGEGWDAETQAWTGRPATEDDNASFADSVLRVAEHARDYWRRRASTGTNSQQQLPLPTIVVGGCCRTQPADIQELRQRIDDRDGIL